MGNLTINRASNVPFTFRISNSGGLYGITTDRLVSESPRNRPLLEVCKFVRTNDANVVEALASGIPATIAALRSAQMPARRFFDQALAFTVTIDRSLQTAGASTTASTTRSADRALLALLDAPRTVKELGAALALSDNAVHKRLATLRAKGLVIMHGGKDDHQPTSESPRTPV